MRATANVHRLLSGFYLRTDLRPNTAAAAAAMNNNRTEPKSDRARTGVRACAHHVDVVVVVTGCACACLRSGGVWWEVVVKKKNRWKRARQTSAAPRRARPRTGLVRSWPPQPVWRDLRRRRWMLIVSRDFDHDGVAAAGVRRRDAHAGFGLARPQSRERIGAGPAVIWRTILDFEQGFNGLQIFSTMKFALFEYNFDNHSDLLLYFTIWLTPTETNENNLYLRYTFK